MKHYSSKGATLAISLMLLFIITLIGLNSIRMTQQQEKMSHNTQDKHTSFNASEASVIYGEGLLGGLSSEPNVTSSAGCPNATSGGVNFCIVNYTNNLLPENQTEAWWTANSNSYNINYPAAVVNKNRVSTSPRYYIEYIKFIADSPAIGKGIPPGTYYYRVFGRGTGVTDNSNSFIETTYRRRY